RAESLRGLPSLEEFLGSESREIDHNTIGPLRINDCWKQPATYLEYMVAGTPMPLRVSSLLMVLSILLAAFIRPGLRKTNKFRYNFDSLLVLGIAYVTAVFGYVFSWADYGNFLASINNGASAAAYG